MSQNLYEILHVSRNCNLQEIRSAYQKLALQFHPDKNKCDDKDRSSNIFISICNAWHVLGNEKLRKEYDALQNEQNLEIQDLPINEIVTLSEMKINQGKEEYSRSCRCGGEYIASASDVTEDCIIYCDTCTLCIELNMVRRRCRTGADPSDRISIFNVSLNDIVSNIA